MSGTTVELPPQDPMLQEVGRGIQAFALVETGAGFCFSSMMLPGDPQCSFAVLDAARHLETKLRIIDAVAAIALDDTLGPRWTNLTNRIRRSSGVRHKLAHWTVSHWPGISSTEDLSKVTVALVPPLSSRSHMAVMWAPNENHGDKPLFEHDLKAFHARCHALFQELVTLGNDIKASKHS